MAIDRDRAARRAVRFGLVAGVVVSVGVHAVLQRLGAAQGLAILPAVVRCRVGELVHVEAVVRTAVGPIPGMAHAVAWTVVTASGAPIARHLGGGLFRCDQAGSALLEAHADDGDARVSVQISPGVIAVDLPPPPPKEDPPEPPPPPPPRVVPRSLPPPVAKEQPPPPAPEAARPAEVLTAPPDPSPAQNPAAVAVSQPGSTASGSGVVATGGTADRGAKGAVAGGVPGGAGIVPSPPAPPQQGPDRSRAPQMVDPDGCQDYYPADAEADSGQVQLEADISLDGRASAVRILKEVPAGQGFGDAVRKCFATQRFGPALDRSGHEAPGRLRINFRFVR